MRGVRVLSLVMVIAAALSVRSVAAQSTSESPCPTFDFSGFIPYTATYEFQATAATHRETYTYRVVPWGDAQALERTMIVEWLPAAAMPRATWRRTALSLAALPDLAPISSRIITHQWTDSTAAWTTEAIESRFEADEVQRRMTASSGEAEESTTVLPTGSRQSEMTGLMFGYCAGPERPSGARLPTYNSETDAVGEVAWDLLGEETIMVLGSPQRAWAVTIDGDTTRIVYYRKDEPRLFLTSHTLGGSEPTVQYRMIRLWCEGPGQGGSCLRPGAVAGTERSDP